MTTHPGTFQPTSVASAYSEALAYLGGRTSRKLANNTYLVRATTAGEALVMYHGNTVIRYRANPRGIIVDSCGWRTFTTKERLNWFLPSGTWGGERWHGLYRVFQEKHVWYLSTPSGRVPFSDGMVITP